MSKGDYPALRMIVDGGRLVPASPFDQERLDSYRRGTVVFCKFTEEKDRVLIRKWFAVLGLVLKQCKTPWKNKDEAHEAIKLALGIVNLSKTVNGQFMQYPRSLAELDDPELQDALEQMIELLSHMTRVDVATLRKEASDVGHEISQSGSSPSEPGTAESEPSSASAASDDTPPSPSSDASLSERELLIKYASDVLPLAATNGTTIDTLKAVDREWAAEIRKMTDAGIQKANAIKESSRAVFNDPAKLDGILEHYAEMLECSVEELGA